MSKKIRRSVSLSREVLDWIDKQIKERRFNNVSHALEYAIYHLMKEEEKEKEG